MTTATARACRQAFAAGLRPDPRTLPSDWAAAHRRIAAEASPHPGRWQDSTARYLKEILDCLAPSNPCESVTVKKSVQVGASEVAMNWLFYIADCTPGPTLVVHPTVEAAKDWVSEKLEPSIAATPRMCLRVADQKSRDGRGSTSKRKRFPGGSWVITGGNSTRALRQKSIRFLVKDDWDDWPLDVDRQGDPDAMADARQTAYTASGQAKRLQISTPTIKGRSRVDTAYEASDQRVYEVPCPQCDEYQELRFFPISTEPFRGGLRFDQIDLDATYYVCEHHGCIINHSQKETMVSQGRWVARNPGPNRQPGFYINSLYSPFTTWRHIAAKWLEAKDNPHQIKTFYNLDLGLAWEERGEAPDWKRLFIRREDYNQRIVPHGGLLLVAAADIQRNGIFYEVVAFGVDRQSWSIDIGFLPGRTEDTEDKCWRDLAEVYSRRYSTAAGGSLSIELFAADSGDGVTTHSVYSWVRGRPLARAIKGQPGWTRPPIGTPAMQEVTWRGKKRRRGILVWPVGTYKIKSELYANLRKDGPRDGVESFPPGYCHFATWHDEKYFLQLTSESLVERETKGRLEQLWMPSGENHYHDCRVYAMAMAELAGLSTASPADWANRAAAAAPAPAGDLFAAAGIAAAANGVRAPSAPEPEPARGGDPLSSSPVASDRPVSRRVIRSRWLG